MVRRRIPPGDDVADQPTTSENKSPPLGGSSNISLPTSYFLFIFLLSSLRLVFLGVLSDCLQRWGSGEERWLYYTRFLFSLMTILKNTSSQRLKNRLFLIRGKSLLSFLPQSALNKTQLERQKISKKAEWFLFFYSIHLKFPSQKK